MILEHYNLVILVKIIVLKKFLIPFLADKKITGPATAFGQMCFCIKLFLIETEFHCDKVLTPTIWNCIHLNYFSYCEIESIFQLYQLIITKVIRAIMLPNLLLI